MTFNETVKAIGGTILVEAPESQQIGHVIASDLMSDVLLVDRENMLVLTSLASDQVLRTAQIVGALGVVVVNGKSLPSTMIGVARELAIGLATIKLPKYEACLAVNSFLTTQCGG